MLADLKVPEDPPATIIAGGRSEVGYRMVHPGAAERVAPPRTNAPSGGRPLNHLVEVGDPAELRQTYRDTARARTV
jgi:hypothetical protein